jgi:hypothetical protein
MQSTDRQARNKQPTNVGAAHEGGQEQAASADQGKSHKRVSGNCEGRCTKAKLGNYAGMDKGLVMKTAIFIFKVLLAIEDAFPNAAVKAVFYVKVWCMAFEFLGLTPKSAPKYKPEYGKTVCPRSSSCSRQDTDDAID